MPVRLFVAVLMLMGQNPVRVCTCAAATHTPVANPEIHSTADSLAPETAGCGCHTKTSRDCSAQVLDERTGVSEREGHPGSDRHPHDPNCPTVTAQPVVAAIPTPASDAPTDCDCAFLVWAEPANDRPVGVADPAHSHLRTRTVPLYISLLTLRN
jgi:hypothetical protein